MIVKKEEEKRIARELRQKALAENAARRARKEKEKEARVDKRFEETRELFRKNVAYWNGTNGQPAKAQTLRVHRDALQRRLLWSENDALNWSRRDDGTYFLDEREIDRIHKPMSLLLQYVKAEHEIAHDRAALALRAQQIAGRAARASASQKNRKNLHKRRTPPYAGAKRLKCLGSRSSIRQSSNAGPERDRAAPAGVLQWPMAVAGCMAAWWCARSRPRIAPRWRPRARRCARLKAAWSIRVRMICNARYREGSLINPCSGPPRRALSAAANRSTSGIMRA